MNSIQLAEDDIFDNSLVVKKSASFSALAIRQHMGDIEALLQIILSVVDVLGSTSTSGESFLSSHHFTSRSGSIFGQRLRWYDFVARHGRQTYFTRHIRMSLDSFHKILHYIYDDLTVDELQASRRGGAIIPEVCLYCAIRYLAGGSYTDVLFLLEFQRLLFMLSCGDLFPHC